MPANSVVDPTVAGSIVYWVEAGSVERRRTRTRAGLGGHYRCTVEEAGEVTGTTYADAVSWRILAYYSSSSRCGPEPVAVAPAEASRLVLWSLASLLGLLDEWVRDSDPVPVRAWNEGHRGIAVLEPGSTRPGPPGVPLGLLVYYGQGGARASHYLPAPAGATGDPLGVVEDALAVLAEQGIGGWRIPRGVWRGWERLRVGGGVVYVSLAYALLRSPGGPWIGDKAYVVDVPLLVIASDRPVRKSLWRRLEELVSVTGKLVYSKSLANHSLAAPFLFRRPLFVVSERELEPLYGDPCRLGSRLLRGSRRVASRGKGKPESQQWWECKGLRDLVKRYSYKAGPVILFPSQYHYSQFVSKLVSQYAGIARIVVGENPEDRRERIGYGRREILGLLLSLESLAATLNEELPRQRTNLMSLEKNIYNLEALTALLGLGSSGILKEARLQAKAAEMEFRQAVERVESAINVLHDLASQVRDLEEAATRVVQERLNDLMTILAAAGLYTLITPLTSRILGKEDPILSLTVTLLLSLSLPVGIRILEHKNRKKIYKR